ncbi:hypothetical protein EXE46_08440 [Halorubrum sp. GN11_10-6_MGM]|uniref:hypothetical protein n=1 Tax=Halorubrum sp. GN11_10-6_MGM TaxID=2518112 RepID=UPI0010F94EFC|nr:hypothetical protein [Halorubrum sp. GN11_10-6_MGM]TKX74556.1 hypothetical protein EXE46_08440 [Halorubrum sp. GN11_10-6_MGM]
MPGPLGDATRCDLTDAAVARLAADGFEVVRPESAAEPPAVATRGDDRVSVEPLAADDATPTVIVSRLGHALARDRRALFVTRDDATATAVRDLLADPPLLADRRDGRRTFHLGPDRIPVAGGGYACVRADGLGDPTFAWRETDTPAGPIGADSDSGADAAAVGDDGRPAVPRLVCEVDGTPVAVLAGVDGLRTPPDEAFPFAYRRDPTDKRFRVRRGDDGAVVETIGGFAALRDAGYVPVPMPLVPEHALGRDVDDEALAAAWDLSVIGGADAESDPDGDPEPDR